MRMEKNNLKIGKRKEKKKKDRFSAERTAVYSPDFSEKARI